MALLLPPSAGLRRVFRVAPPRQDHADLSHRRKPRACCPSWPWSCLNVVQISKADFCMLIALSGSSLGKVSVPFVLIPCCHDHPSLSCLPSGPPAALRRLAGVLDALLRLCVPAVAAPLNGRAHGAEQRPGLANSSERGPTGPNVSLGVEEGRGGWDLKQPARLPHRFRRVRRPVLEAHFPHKHAHQLGVRASQTATGALEVAYSCRRA